MDLEKWFFPDKLPGQMLYLGEERSLLLIRGKDGRWRERATLPHSLAHVTAISSLPGAVPGPLGISLNPHPFVFNLFNFETPLPLNRRKRSELIDWRLQRVFPDSPENMVKNSLVFRRRIVFSFLVSADLLQSCERHFLHLGHPLTFISCSTIAAIEKSPALSAEPLMILEQEGQLLMVTVVNRGLPLFARKIRFSQIGELVTGLRKTLAFVGEQQGIKVRSYLFSPLGGTAPQHWVDELEELQAIPLSGDASALFLP